MIAISRERAVLLVGLALGVLGGLVLLAWPTQKLDSQTANPGALATHPVRFADETLALGVTTEHRQGDDRLTGLDEALGSGACALDFDNDGWLDLFIVNGSGDTRYYGRPHWWQHTAGQTLLRNRGDGHFEDVTPTALSTHPIRGFGCVTADFDNDGNTDILVTGFDENLLLRNLGNGRFLDVTEKAGLEGYGWQTAVAVADVDGDGLLDIYVGRFIAFQKGAHTYEPGSQYKQDVPASFNPALYPAQAKSLYRNLGGFRFQDVAEKAGVADADGRTLGAIWLDLNGDHRPDLIVTNAAGTGSNAVFRNEGKWRFTALGADTRLQSGAGARGATLADLDNDGVPELLVTATNGAQSAIFVRQGDPESSHPSFIDRARQWDFARDAYSGFSPWSAVAADFDNDGWLDVFVANGLAVPDADVPRVTVGQPKQLWLNSHHGSLRAQEFAATDPVLDRQSARGVVAADFDNDGDIDLYITHNNDLGQLLINQSTPGAHWVGLHLVNTEGNRDAIGARVELVTDEGKQYRWIVNSMGFLSGSDPRVHFGLGGATGIERLVVTWPDGDKSKLRNVPVDRYVTVKRGEALRVQQALAHAAHTNYASLTHGREPALRADYIRLLVEARGLDASLDEIRASLTDEEPAVRKSSVAILAAHRSAASLAVLLDAFSDRDAEVVTAAVSAVCPYEEEAAVRWLLRLFAHPQPAVRTAVASCFEYYLSKQEGTRAAVVHRKYLAIPYLVEALADKSENVQIAAARALGNAERYRGVPPLLELAARTPSAQVRAAAIRSVGLIHDKQATGGLLALLKSEKLRSEPEGLAELLVALKRLDYSALPAMLTAFGSGHGDFARMPVRARLVVMRRLLASEDGVVMPRAEIAALARRSYQGAGDSLDEATTVALVDVLGETGSRDSLSLLNTLADSGRTAAVRAAALRVLCALDPIRAASYIEKALEASDAEIARRLLDSLAGRGATSSEKGGGMRVDLSDRVFTAALARPDERGGVLAVMRRVHGQSAAAAVFAIASDVTAAATTRAAALDVLTRSAFTFTVPPELYTTHDAALAQAVVQYEMSRLPALYVSRTAPAVVTRVLATRSDAVRLAMLDALAHREEFWAKASILGVLKSSQDTALRARVVDLIAGDALQGSQILETIAADKSDPLRLAALSHLEGREGSSAERLLASVLHDNSEDLHARVIAAHRLVGRLGPEVLAILERTS